jgi:putative oxidoreductase
MSRSVTPSIHNPASLDRSTVEKLSELSGRILLSLLFLLSGLLKIPAYAATAAYMSSIGVPAALLPLVIAVEFLGAVAIIVGWKTRIAAFLLGGLTVLAAALFHSDFADLIQAILFMRDLSITGAFLLLMANGAGPLSLDHWLSK